MTSTRSGNQAQEELDPARDAALDLGASGGCRQEMAAGLAFVERDAMDMDLLARQGWRLTQFNGVRRDAATEVVAAAVGAGRRRRGARHRRGQEAAGGVRSDAAH